MKKYVILTLYMSAIVKYCMCQSVLINPQGTAIINVNSNLKGVKLPLLNCNQVTQMSNPDEGVIVYNSTAHAINYYDGTTWRYIDGRLISEGVNVGGIPANPTTTNITTTEATLNWASVPNATSYLMRYHQAPNEPNWIEVPLSLNTLSYTLTGLIPSTSYEWQVQSRNPCGGSTFSSTGSFTTSTPPPMNATITIVALGYNPSDVTIALGGTVTWQGNFSNYPLRSGTPANPTNLFYVSYGTSFNYIFNQAGTYPFFCPIYGFTGNITVVP